MPPATLPPAGSATPARAQTHRSSPVRVSPRSIRRASSRLARLPGRLLGRLPGRLLSWAGRDPARFDLTTACRQCGESSYVRLLRLGPRRVRYWCGHCGAIVTLASRAEIRVREDRPATIDHPPFDVDLSTTSDVEPAPVPQIMPAAMLRWAESRSRRPIDRGGLDRASLYQLYKGWDAHLASLSTAEVARLAVDGEPPPQLGLPSISTVVGTLHDRCYHSELVLQAVLAATPGTEEFRRAAFQRIEHARCWLAARPDERCWIISRQPQGTLAQPARQEVEAAIVMLRSTGELDAAAGQAARAALFGTDGGPAMRTLQAVYPADQLLPALTEYLASGARPLRADVLARLRAPARTRP